MVCFLLLFWFSFNVQEGKLHGIVIFINNFLRSADGKQVSSVPGDVSEEGDALHFPVFLCSLLAAEFMLWELWNFSSLACTGDPRLLTYFAYASGIHAFFDRAVWMNLLMLWRVWYLKLVSRSDHEPEYFQELQWKKGGWCGGRYKVTKPVHHFKR